MIDVADLPRLYLDLRSRYSERDDRMDTMSEVVAGTWTVQGDDLQGVEDRSPNMVQVALEDTAEAASLIPSVKVRASGADQKNRDDAATMNQIAVSYLDRSQVELLTIRTLMDLAGFGQFAWIVDEDESGAPRIQWRDPKTFYPEYSHHAFGSVRRAIFVQDLYLSALPEDWQEKVNRFCAEHEIVPNEHVDEKIILLEYYDDNESVACALYKQGAMSQGLSRTAPTYIPIELSRSKNPGELCPVVSQKRLSLDNEVRGQFDQVVRVMQAHIRLMALVLDYADQAVYSDVWVKDLIGEMPMGGGSYINLGPNGAIGRVAPAVTSMSVFQEMSQLTDAMHLGGRWPKVRPGEVDQAIASAKFVEATAGMMNTVIRTYHLIMKRAWDQALRVCFARDKAAGKGGRAVGILRNQQFQIDYSPDDIDLNANVSVEYGVGLGRDPAQAMVLGIQARQAGFVSGEFVQENFEGITDVQLERERIDVEQFRDMALAKMMQGLEDGSIPGSALVKIAQARRDGQDIFALYEEYVAKPAEEAQEGMLTSGLDGSEMMPGPAPALSGAPAPTPPGPEQIMGGPESTSRLSTPLGNGSFAGTEVRGGA